MPGVLNHAAERQHYCGCLPIDHGDSLEVHTSKVYDGQEELGDNASRYALAAAKVPNVCEPLKER